GWRCSKRPPVTETTERGHEARQATNPHGQDPHRPAGLHATRANDRFNATPSFQQLLTRTTSRGRRMGFLKRFFRNAYRDAMPAQLPSSFEHLSEEELEAHLGVMRYGDFVLSEAIRPSYDLQVVPSQGFRHDFYVDESSKTRVPVLMAAATSDRLCQTFLARLSTCA